MPWPQAQEYNEAIQTPSACFADPDLRQGKVRLNKQQLPQAISGGFASVYQLTTPTGVWAVRCFIKQVPDSHRRYIEISKVLNTQRPSYTAPFEYQLKGIRVAGKTYPIVKMQWLSGELLGDYVAKNITNPTLLGTLADRFAAMITDLRTRNLAHGDLQHGNVVIVNHEPKLIDYDGMYVPAFKGMRSNEIGHPNFQHPARRESDFGPYIDNFSAWVIYTSLRALATTPQLYQLSRGLGRDECIIFSREDFASPGASPLFSQLQSDGDPTLRHLAQQITGYLGKLPRDVPPLDVSRLPQITPAAQPDHVSTPVSEWWRDHLPSPKKEPVAPTITLDIPAQPLAQREMLGFFAMSLAAFGAGYSGGIGIAGYFILQVSIVFVADRVLRRHYHSCPSVVARDRHLQEVALKVDELASKMALQEDTKKKITENEHRLAELQSKIQGQISETSSRQGTEIKQAQTELAIARANLNTRKAQLKSEQDRELQRLLGTFESDARALNAQLNQLPTKRASMVKGALDRIRADSLDTFLRQHYISAATIGGIGERFKLNLAYAGVKTAADVTFGNVRRVQGFGQTRTSSVMAWRQSLVAHYENRLPNQISSTAQADIDRKIQSEESQLQSLRRSLELKINDARAQVTRMFDPRSKQLDAEDQQISANAQAKITAINTKYHGLITTIQTKAKQEQMGYQRELTNGKVALPKLDAAIRRIHEWNRDEGAPLTRSYESLTYGRFLKTVFLTKFTP